MKLILGYIIIDIGKTWLAFVYAISVFVIMKTIVFNNNNNGNFICVFECTIVNLATYRQFTNAAWDWIIKKKKTKNKTKQKPKKKIKIALSLGYPSSYFYNKRCNMLL